MRFLMDNRTAVAYLCKQGGTRSRSSTVIAERLFRVAVSLDLSLSATYLPGEMNVLADMLSRAGQVLKNNGDWGTEPSSGLAAAATLVPPRSTYSRT